jgi:hypothetical protein
MLGPIPEPSWPGRAESASPGHPRLFSRRCRKKDVDARVERSALAINDAGNAGGSAHDETGKDVVRNPSAGPVER